MGVFSILTNQTSQRGCSPPAALQSCPPHSHDSAPGVVGNPGGERDEREDAQPPLDGAIPQPIVGELEKTQREK